jgi:hypothetical protein
MRCHKCGAIIQLEMIGRRDECHACGADLHVCLNCDFREVGRANECFEPQAERVKEKDKSNFCDFFRFRKEGTAAPGKDEAHKRWNDLFKKDGQ